MAEARSVATLGGEFTAGTRVGLSIDDEGLHLRTHITVPRPREAIRRFALWLQLLYRKFVYTFLPFGPAFICGFTALTIAVVVKSSSDSWVRSGPIAELVWKIGQVAPWLPGVPLVVRVGVLAAWTSLMILFILAVLQRIALKLLLSDKTFLYHSRAPTLWVKVWFMLVRALTFRRPLLYSFQGALPKLPVPKIQETVKKYLESARQLQSEEQFKNTEKLATEFLNNEGPRLQFYLNLKSWISSNYVTDWWEKYVYLRGRSSLAINSNYYVLDSGDWQPTYIQEARAGVVVFSMLNYKERLVNENIEPTMVGDGAVPLCMWQFERMFAASRLPGRECDEIKHWNSSNIRHIVVNCKGTHYKVNVYHSNGRLRGPDELEDIFAEIKKDAATRKPRDAEARISALTGENRTKWAEVRETYLLEGTNNRRSLQAIESALFYVSLSDKKYDTADWTNRARNLIGGDKEQPNVWFDKTINLVVFADGKTGLNCEHAWADAPVNAHMYEVSMIVGEEAMQPYEKDGPNKGHVMRREWQGHVSCGARSATDEASWTPLVWNLSHAAEEAILAAHQSLNGLIDDLDIVVGRFNKYGKDFVKKCRVSPDAYIQMAMQLAYYRDQGHFDATYESSMTRLFLHGRTETVRPVTKESCEFVKLMMQEKAEPAAKLKALQNAAKRHVLGYTDAMCGKGIDRHLFALYVVSVGKSVDSPFLKNALSVPWKLSTSQQPQQQTTLWDIKDPKNAHRISPGGGFGPVAEDGYGVSYMVAGEHEFFFHVSSKFSSGNTDSKRFQQNIYKALEDMQEVLALALKEAAAAAKQAALGSQ